MDLIPTPVGSLDRGGAVGTVLSRLAAGRSAWNAADVRGEVEQLIAAAGIVVDAGERMELAEDLTARTMARCVLLLDQQSVPEHIRAWTSQPVLDVEDDLMARFAARSAASRLPAARPLRSLDRIPHASAPTVRSPAAGTPPRRGGHLVRHGASALVGPSPDPVTTRLPGGRPGTGAGPCVVPEETR